MVIEVPKVLLPLIYVATPLSDPTPEGVAQNVAFAEATCRMVSMCGGAPYAPHLLLTRFLHDHIPEQREMGIQCGLRTMEGSDLLLAALPPWRDALSRGMKAESETAGKLGLPVVLCPDAPALDDFLDKLRRGQVVRRLAPTPHGP